MGAGRPNMGIRSGTVIPMVQNPQAGDQLG